MFSFAFTASAQKLIDSPFSRFNIGTLQPQGSFRSLSMGGTGIAMRDNSSIYYSNPASYSSLDTISFVFDFGLDFGRNFISGTSSKFSSDDINFHHLIMGFPLAKGWGFSVGVVPFSSGYYNITDYVTASSPEYDSNIGEYSVFHSGDGGITKYFAGTGLRIGKHFSIGVNLNYLSGQISRTNQFIFTDYQNAFHNNSSEKLEIKGFGADYGLQYTVPVKEKYFLNIGASLSGGSNYSTRYNELSLKYTAFNLTDTISFTASNYTKTFIPSTISLGVSFGKLNKFTTGIDYVASRWSASKIPGSTGYAADTRKLMFGAEFIPDKFSNYSFLSRIEYRIGAHTGNNYLIINGEQIKEYGASFGIGVPLRRTYSKANLYFDYTRKSGISSGSLRREDYMTMGISLNLYDNWFMKRKYD
jgi:hypothetical protein